MRIAVDAMGGDHGPRVIVPGALRGLASLGPEASLILLGDEDAIRRAMPADAPTHTSRPRRDSYG